MTHPTTDSSDPSPLKESRWLRWVDCAMGAGLTIIGCVIGVGWTWWLGVPYAIAGVAVLVDPTSRANGK